jgi:hypothetical protein
MKDDGQYTVEFTIFNKQYKSFELLRMIYMLKDNGQLNISLKNKKSVTPDLYIKRLKLYIDLKAHVS